MVDCAAHQSSPPSQICITRSNKQTLHSPNSACAHGFFSYVAHRTNPLTTRWDYYRWCCTSCVPWMPTVCTGCSEVGHHCCRGMVAMTMMMTCDIATTTPLLNGFACAWEGRWKRLVIRGAVDKYLYTCRICRRSIYTNTPHDASIM